MSYNPLNLKVAGAEHLWKPEECSECGIMTKFLSLEQKCPGCDTRVIEKAKAEVIL